MFEAVEVGSSVTKDDYKERIPELRVGLINAQYDLREADFSVVIVLSGDDRVGCNEALRTMHELLDGRYMRTNALGRPTSEELERPRFWRYWRTLPRKGQIGVFLGGWPLNVIRDRVNGRLSEAELDRRLEHIRTFEQDLVADGALVLKFWLHVPKRVLKSRLKRAKKNPREVWQIEADDWKAYEKYGEAIEVAERVIRETDTADSPWQLIESTNARYRDLTITEAVHDAVVARLEGDTAATPNLRTVPHPDHESSQPTILDTVDLSRSLSRTKYRGELARAQAEVSHLSNKAFKKGVSTVMAFEGWDAAGKGGVIRRLTSAIDPELCSVVPIAAPTPEELAYPYLWRFWRHVPRRGHNTIFDRSWYGRVLVERVEGFASEPEWRRAYSEINDFEEQLYEKGIVLMKFWLHLDRDEQLARFEAREVTPYKKHKITAEDYRNRAQWPLYEHAVHDMVSHTSTADAPWDLVASNSKRWARIEVLNTYCERLERVL